MKRIACAALAAAAMAMAAPAAAAPPAPAVQEQPAAPPELIALLQSLKPVPGEVVINEAEAVLHLGQDYYFLGAEDARRVLVEGWGNPPDAAEDVLGMVFPAGKTFLDDTWGAVISWEPTGYVSDEDAQQADYQALIAEMQAGEADLNEARTGQGYPAQHLVGWAQAPAYDAANHSVVWAQNIQFSGQPENTLNYDVRLLGRRGVLSLNMITGMSRLEETRTAAAKFASAAEFKPGARYADYKPGTDAKAEYGVAGLVAAGVGAAAAKKVGLLAVILAFGKKFFILVIGAFVALGAWVNRRFLGGGDPQEEYADTAWEEPDSEPEAHEAEAVDAVPGIEPPEPEPRPA